MYRLFLVITLFITTACATPSPSSNLTASVPTVESASDEVLTSGEPADSIEDDDASIGVGIEGLDTPEVQEIPAAMIPNFHVNEPSVICTREIPTGSRLAVEVCRQRSEIERRQEADQKLINQIKTNTAIGASRL